MPDAHYFDDVSLLITHYNRSKSLERLLTSFAQQSCTFKEVVVSDDGSQQVHIDYLRNLKSQFNFTLVTAEKNGGLGKNINKGQDAVKTKYTLYVQEDFILLDNSVTHLKHGRQLMEEDSGLDMIRFYAYLNYPNLRPLKWGFSEMIFRLWGKGGLPKFAFYSDHPHLRKSDFMQKFGRYPEGKNPENTEYVMMVSVIKKKGRGLFFENYKDVFDQVNTSAEPSSMKRKFWRYSANFLIVSAISTYRYLKFYYNYFF